MAKYNFRILVRTWGGREFSYQSSSLVDTSDKVTFTTEELWNRITGSKSCSFQNTAEYTDDLYSLGQLKNNQYVSSSISGSRTIGSIVFSSTGPQGTDKDALKEVKFYGNKVCSVLNIPENLWLKSQEFKLTSGSENHYLKGDIVATSMTVLNNFNVSNVGSVTSDLPFKIDKTSDRWVRFINVSSSIPNNDLIFGYDKDLNEYQISASSGTNTTKFNIYGVDELQATSLNVTSITSSYTTSSVEQIFTQITSSGNSQFGDESSDIHTFTGQINASANISSSGYSGSIINLRRDTLGSGDPYLEIRNDANYSTARTSVKFTSGSFSNTKGSDSAEVYFLTHNAAQILVLANYQSDGKIQFYTSGSVIAEFGHYGENNLQKGMTLSGDITASGNISASGDLSIFGEVVHLEGTDPRLKLKGGAGEHPGYEIHDGSNRKWVIYNDPDDSHNLNIKTDSNDRFSITQAGKVGIGKTGPTKELEVVGDISASGNIHINTTGKLYFGGSTPGATNGRIQWGPSNTNGDVSIYATAGAISIMSGSTFKHKILNAGDSYVGLGNNSPVEMLTVEGNISASGGFFLQNSASIGTATQKGMFQVDYGNNAAFTGSLAAAGDGYGEIVSFIDIDDSVSAGDVVAFRNLGTGWVQADKDTQYATVNMLGVAMQDGDSGTRVLIKGFIRLASGHISDTSAGNEGDPLYVGDSGHVTYDPSTTGGDFVRVVGYSINELTAIIYFNPGTTWVEVAS